MTRREFSKSTKRAALTRSGHKCEAVGPRYGFEEGQRCNCSLSLGVQFDHDVPDGLGGDNSLENCRAVCVQCHRWKTGNDVAQIAKMKRQRDRNTGIKDGPKLKGRPLPKSTKSARREKREQLPLPKRRALFEERT